MKAIQIQEYVPGPLSLRVTSIPDPIPTADQYLIAIKACATNFFDLLQIRGKYQHQPPLPWTSGAEFSGIILSCPSSSSSPKFRPGDPVFGSSQGSYAQLICCTESQIQPLPSGWNFLDAAGLFVTMPTSYAALITRANLQAGEWVLVHAAAGGVGLAAVQIAKARGATVIATAGTKEKLEIAKRFGADFGVCYRENEDWTKEVLKLRPRGVDVVFDPVGLISPSQKCIAWNGRLLVVGFAGGPIEKIATNRILLKNISVVGIHWGAYAKFEPQRIEEVWRELLKLMENKEKIRPTNFTDKVYRGLEDVPKALEALGGRETWGKVVVDLPEGRESRI
ncbi:quinone oxidoreductase [Sphaerulina musiva SO2202]|uniref:Quinone oxidoreductase n=1 Tax=Sphaerulina musiva (strain SO2202) TaxID=692275 RepID=M3C197_SPHMS|nr:quinone oxidoreductase [Sphaerulina musiva SO2202]EMF14071.1 quinone oxidoreductase [Sphaerulina musiva SO2202]